MKKYINFFIFVVLVALPYVVVFLFRNNLSSKNALYIIFIPILGALFIGLKNYLSTQSNIVWSTIGFIVLIITIIMIIIGYSLGNMNFIM